MAESAPPLHASAVATNGQAALIMGAPGRGKSSLALQLIGLGAELIADDRTHLTLENGSLWASAPDAIKGQIEARGIGILRSPAGERAKVALVIDLDQSPVTDRMPEPRKIDLMGCALPLLQPVNAAHFPASILIWLRHGPPL